MLNGKLNEQPYNVYKLFNILFDKDNTFSKITYYKTRLINHFKR